MAGTAEGKQMSIKPEVQAIIDRVAAIDWRNPPHDEVRVKDAYQRRLGTSGLTRTVRWITDPADIDARDAWAAWVARDARAAWAAWAAWVARDARAAWAAWAARVARDARAAWDAWDARDARVAWDAWDARDARVARVARAAWAARVARDAWDAWAAWDAWDAWAAVGWLNIEPSTDTTSWLPRLVDTYAPMIDAYESGSFAHILTETEVLVLASPAIHIDAENRLHRPDGAALEWPRTKVYAWHGTVVPDSWIAQRNMLTGGTVLAERNLEVRRAGIEMLGWPAVLRDINARTIDADADHQIGTLVEVDLPDLDKPARFLRVRCGTGRDFAIGVPPTIETALAAQAWMVGLSETKFQKPEIRS
jgi:hypothetical protein